MTKILLFLVLKGLREVEKPIGWKWLVIKLTVTHTQRKGTFVMINVTRYTVQNDRIPSRSSRDSWITPLQERWYQETLLNDPAMIEVSTIDELEGALSDSSVDSVFVPEYCGLNPEVIDLVLQKTGRSKKVFVQNSFNRWD
jgi:hypothetical protein